MEDVYRYHRRLQDRCPVGKALVQARSPVGRCVDWLLVAWLIAPWACSTAAAATGLGERAFTLKDLIEWQYISPVLDGRDEWDERTVASLSPKGDQFAVRTTRGDLSLGAVRDRIFIYSTVSVTAYLGRGSQNPVPTPVANFERAPPTEDHQTAYVRWLSNAELAFIGHADNGTSQVFVADTHTHQLHQITSSPTDITSYAMAGERLIYFAANVDPRPRTITATDYTLPGEMIAPSTSASASTVSLFVAARHQAGTKSVAFPAVRLRQSLQKIWISPSGKLAVVRLPAIDWPLYWQDYRIPHCDYLCFTPDRRTKDSTSYQLWNRQQFYLVNLDTLIVHKLVDAPTGTLAFTGAPSEVFWMKGEKSVILSTTYLPLKDVDEAERARRVARPAISEVEIDSGQANAIVWDSPSPGHADAAGNTHHIASEEWNPDKQLLKVCRNVGGASPVCSEHWKSGSTWNESKGNVKAREPFTTQIQQGLNTPPRLTVTGGKCRCQRVLLDPNPQAPEFSFGTNEVYEWTDQYGLKWQGGLVLPPRYVPGKRYPLIVQTHGFDPHFFLLDGPDDYHTGFAAQVFANAGFLVLQVGENSGIEETKTEAKRYAEGFRSGIQSLVTNGMADRERVAAIAFSRTGMGVLQLMADYPHELAAAVIADAFINGYAAQVGIPRGYTDLRAQWRAAGILSFFDMPFEKWWNSTPMSKLGTTQTPTLVQTIDADQTLASWELYSTLRGYGRPAELLYLPHGSHVLFNPADRVASQARSLDWLRFWLRGEEDPSELKREQYARWHQQRSSWVDSQAHLSQSLGSIRIQ